jgi:hypothetical protein
MHPTCQRRDPGALPTLDRPGHGDGGGAVSRPITRNMAEGTGHPTEPCDGHEGFPLRWAEWTAMGLPGG